MDTTETRIGQFKHPVPHQQLFKQPLDAMRRRDLFIHACNENFIRADQATPTKGQLIRIIQEGVVIADTAKLLPEDQSVPLVDAHKPASPTPLVAETDEDDLFGDMPTTQDDIAILNKFLAVHQVPLLRKMFLEQFPDAEPIPNMKAGYTKAQAIDRVKKELGLD